MSICSMLIYGNTVWFLYITFGFNYHWENMGFYKDQQVSGILITTKSFIARIALCMHRLILFSQETYEVDTIISILLI